jgi:hypothetical protein
LQEVGSFFSQQPARYALDGSQTLDGVVIEYSVAIFRNKDQVNVHFKNAMPTMPYIVVIANRPRVLLSNATTSSL